MADLGEFGRAVTDHYEESDTFRFHGEQFEVPALLSSLPLMEFTAEVKRLQRTATAAEATRDNALGRAKHATTPEDEAAARADADAAVREILTCDGEATEAQYAFIRACVGEQWMQFRDVAVRHGVHGDELMDVCARIYEAVSGRPTRRLSDSSGGPSSSGDGSTGNSVSLAPTPGPGRPFTGSGVVMGEVMGEVIELTPAQIQQGEFRRQMAPVGDLLTRSGG